MIASFLRKTALVFLGVVLFLVLLEVGLRLGGFILFSMQTYKNFQSIKQKGAYRILCLGESTTQGTYPKPLEQVLNQRNIGVRFSVIDKGKTETNSIFILNQVEAYLDEYRPDMVVAMMGINDEHVTYYQDIPESDTWLFRHCRVYKFCRILYMQLLNKLQRRDIYRSGGAGSGGKAKSEDAKAVVKKTTPSKEMLAEEVARLDSESEKGSPGPNGRFSGVEKFLGKDAKLDFAETTRSTTVGMRAVPGIEETGWVKPGLAASSAPSRAGVSTPDDVYVQLGAELCRERGKLIEAEASFRKAIELNVRNDSAYVELGRLYRLQDKLPQAENVLKKAIGLNPENDKAHIELGWVYNDQGELSQSLDMFKKAIDLDPKNDFNQVTIGGVYRRQGEFSQAEDSFKKAIELNPANEFALLELGALYREQGKFSEAEDLFKKAIGINFERANERILRALASLYEETGKPELAQEYVEKVNGLMAAHYGPHTVHNYRRLKEILDRRGIRLVCMQYPMRNVGPLKRIFENDKGVIFVDNESIFKEAVRRGGYKEYFRDMFAGDFGHCTPQGNELLAQNIADVILRKVFAMQRD